MPDEFPLKAHVLALDGNVAFMGQGKQRPTDSRFKGNSRPSVRGINHQQWWRLQRGRAWETLLRAGISVCL